MEISGQFVRVVLEEDFTDLYDGRRFVIPAGKETMIPVEAAKLWFGWPTINSDNPNIREEEIMRVEARRGGVQPKVLSIEADTESVRAASPTGKAREAVTATRSEDEEQEFADLDLFAKRKGRPKKEV